MNNLGMCQIEGCTNPARFFILHTEGEIKTPKYVCAKCEARIGHENLLRARRASENRT